MSSLYFDIVRALGATERVHGLVMRKPEIVCDSSQGVQLSPSEFLGNIEFKNVNFTYPSRKDNPVLRDFNLSLKPGQVYNTFMYLQFKRL